jgi:hypothetical protein
MSRYWIDVTHGVSDEGEAWIAICQPDTGYTYTHITMRDGVIHYTSCRFGMATYLTVPEMIESRDKLLTKEEMQNGPSNIQKTQQPILVGEGACF